MEKLERKMEYMSEYSVVMIKMEKEGYFGYILKYDGEIFQDVKIADAQFLISHFPNIKKQLENNYFYHLVYNFDLRKYQSSLILPEKKEKYRIIKQEEIVDDFIVSGNSILDSMIELDHMIAVKEFRRKQLKKEFIKKEKY